MSFLIDTNIISEVRKAERCHPRVAAWYASVEDEDMFLSVLVLGEVRKGIERARPRDPAKAAALESWLGQVIFGFAGRVLGVDVAVCDQWGRMAAIRSLPMVDALLAATAVVHKLTLVTRNDRDVAGLGVPVLNPFEGDVTT
jgi:predicted nucleic acid-binding protein